MPGRLKVVMSSQQTLSRPVEGPEFLLTGNGTLPERDSARAPFKLFFLWLFFIPVVLYVTAIPLVRVPSYERWGPSHWGPVLDFAFNTQGLNADMVIFGDSSAFLGIDPRVVDQQLHIKAVVLPNTVGSLPVDGDQALEYYLAHNTRPRLIVLYFAAWDLDYASSKDTHLYEGEEIMLRHGSWSQILRFALQHPLELPAFPLRDYTSIGSTWIQSLLHKTDRMQETAKALGHVDDREDYPALAKDCRIPSRYLDARNDTAVRTLAAKYRERGYKVAVYLAPMPDCSNARALPDKTYDNLALAPPAKLPPSDFKGDGLYAHVQPESVPAASHLFAQTIAAQLGN